MSEDANQATRRNAPETDAAQLVLSTIVPGFRRVELAKGSQCVNPQCQAPLTPQAFRCDESVVELICGACHVTQQRLDLDIEIAEDDDDFDDNGEA